MNYQPKKTEAIRPVCQYQELIQPLLGQKAFWVAVSAPFLIYFIYKNFPTSADKGSPVRTQSV